jgi:hypothetical protein
MAILIQAVSAILSIISLVCFIMVVVKMFQNGQTGLGIASIVLIFCCGIGGLIAFVYGWMKSAEWSIQNIMMAWTGCIVLNILLSAIGYGTGIIPLPNVQAP